MAKVCTLFSSSKGNSTYISCSSASVLVDAGRSAKQLCDAMKSFGADPARLSGIFITHEHCDHICGLSVMVKRFRIPVYATHGTLTELLRTGVIKESDEIYEVSGDGVQLGGLFVTPFTTSHDCCDSCGYTIDMCEGRKIAVCTDLGYISESVKNALVGSDLAIIESNHDVDMLKTGPYPYSLKKRILGLCGHLSNNACADILPFLAANGTTRFILAHLSQENNLPSLAYRTSKKSLDAAGLAEGSDYILKVAAPSGSEPVIL